jgi:hypothetical protein
MGVRGRLFPMRRKPEIGEVDEAGFYMESGRGVGVGVHFNREACLCITSQSKPKDGEEIKILKRQKDE